MFTSHLIDAKNAVNNVNNGLTAIVNNLYDSR